jgi:hypothetical protein
MLLRTGGELVAVDPADARMASLVSRAVGAATEGTARAGETPTVRLRLDPGADAFERETGRPVTRGASSDGRRTVLADVGGSGFDLAVTVDGDALDVIARYRPSPRARVANSALRARFALLAGQVLVHYPVLWRAGWRGRVPLHASVVAMAEGTPLPAGPGGVGKSTVLWAAMEAGAVATADNLGCCGGVEFFGLAEPLRLDAASGGGGPRTSHGRVTRRFGDRAESLTPDRLVILERGPRTDIASATPAEVARALVAGTYAAGELRRYWAFAATLALATGRGPAHPPIDSVALELAGRLPGRRVRIGDGDAVSTARLCGVDEGSAHA